MNRLGKYLLTMTLALGLAVPASGQDIGETLKDLAEENAKGYLGPLATAFGTGMNSGTFRTAKPHKLLGFDLTLNVTMTAVPDAATTYVFTLPDRPYALPAIGGYTIEVPFSSIYESGYETPTFFGEDEPGVIPVDALGLRSTVITELATESGQSEDVVASTFGTQIDAAIGTIPDFQTPGGLGFQVWPNIMPQFSLGLPFKTEVTLRGGSISTDKGDITFGGFGAKIGLNQFIPTIPLVFPAISVGYYASNMDFADIVVAKNSILTLQASKSIPMLTVYGGLGLESSSIDVEYALEYEDLDGITQTEDIAFSLDGDNSTRFIVGFRLKLLLLSINADYNVGEFAAYNLGVGLTFR
ncbi:MAG: hypothetical protein KAU50_02860 [Candidatus Marinimicrobia bacterium]|nr:hypothetical protein [Candidatus Neomarinimicrobiota bacterium]